MANQPCNFVWYELICTETAVAKRFYSDLAGWSAQDKPLLDGTYSVMSAATLGIAGIVALPPARRTAGAPLGWVGYVHCSNVDETVQRLQSLGGSLRQAPADIPATGRFAIVADPQGAQFHLFTPIRHGGQRSRTHSGHVGWHELHTSDWPRALEFYQAMFDWQCGERVDMGEQGVYQVFNIGGTAVGGMMNSPVAATTPRWLFYIVVADIDTASAGVSAGGGKVLLGPHRVPGGAWIIQGTDPQGAWFALMGPRR
jgi:predicted enzyme related to lactoylglutathione lyase